MHSSSDATADILGADRRPLFFPLDASVVAGLDLPDPSSGVSTRTWVRSLAGMQKEAIVANVVADTAWRLVSDEGPYLSGHDAAPCPLSFMTTGMLASYIDMISREASRRGLDLGDVRVRLDNRYTMEGSALRRTMTGGALPPEVSVWVSTDVDQSELRDVVATAIAASPIASLMGHVRPSRFSLSLNGEPISISGVDALDGSQTAAQADMDTIDPGPPGEDIIVKLTPAAEVRGVPGGVASSLAENQRRTLHVRGDGVFRPDGIKSIVQNLYQPIGSEFRFLSEEAPVTGGGGRAPDAVTYMSAGIGFCFMTQVGRFASIVKRPLAAYRIVQDVSLGSTGTAGVARPVETHLHIESDEDADYARDVLTMSEQTCFLHAMCRTELEPAVEVRAGAPSAASRT